MADRTKNRTTDLGEMIKFLRKVKRYTQLQLSEKVNKSESTIRAWENEGVEPDLQTITILADIFSVPVGLLLNEPYVLSKPIEQWSPDYIEDYHNASCNAERRYLCYKYGMPKYEKTPSDGFISVSEDERALLNLIRALPKEARLAYTTALEAALKAQGLIP